MSRRPFIVLADDLTGAAELAGIAHQAGLRALVLTGPPPRRVSADVIVCDTDTRLASPTVAARRVGALARALSRRPHRGFFKKTDSVLRGNVLAEIRACARALGLRRTLLLPCNPSLGRIIDNGTYSIGSVPLHRTAFARDPHHPRRTANVLALLGGTRAPAGAACCHPAERPPAAGVVVGEARSPADVALWASQLDARTLPAGGADFFRAWLMQNISGATAAPRRLGTGAALLLSGTATPPEPATPLPGPIVAVTARAVPAPATLAAEAAANLRAHGSASILVQGPVVRSPRTRLALNRLLVSVAQRLREARAFEHLLITGGATAAGVLATLGWTQLNVVHVWGPGVVTLAPAGTTHCVVTVKPGSYRWPAALLRHFEQLAAA
jgi:uncharacterized protein YgbK (DUF1537 family)